MPTIQLQDPGAEEEDDDAAVFLQMLGPNYAITARSKASKRSSSKTGKGEENKGREDTFAGPRRRYEKHIPSQFPCVRIFLHLRNLAH